MLALPPRVASLIRIVGLVLIDWTIITSNQPPALHGRGLVVAVLSVLATGAWVAWAVRAARERAIATGRDTTRGALERPELLVMAGAGGLLTAAAPGSAASAFVFVALVGGSLRMELAQVAVIGLLGTCTLAIGTLLYDENGLALLAYALGFCAAALAGSNSRQSARRAEQAELLLAQAQRSHEEQLRAARLEESTRIARDIHDVLAHTLAGLTIQLEATAALLESGAERSDILFRVRRAHELAREGLQETRRAVGALRAGGPLPVAEALEALTSDYRAATGAPASLSVSGDPARLAGRAGEAVVRITQEALTNVKKHAFGGSVTIRLAVGDASAEDGATLVVEDRTAGRQADAPTEVAVLSRSGGGFGVQGMRERAAELGGRLSAGPGADPGWRVELWLPPSAIAGPTEAGDLPAAPL